MFEIWFGEGAWEEWGTGGFSGIRGLWGEKDMRHWGLLTVGGQEKHGAQVVNQG